MAEGHSDTLNGRGDSVRLLKEYRQSVKRQPRSATSLNKWRGEESPYLQVGEDVKIKSMLSA